MISRDFLRACGGDRQREFAQNDRMFRVRSIRARMLLSAIGVVIGWFFAMPATALSHEEWLIAFVRFLDWPAPLPDNTLVICVHHDDPALELDGKQVRGLKLQVRRVPQPRRFDGCHVYSALSQSESNWTRSLSGLNALHSSDSNKAQSNLPTLAIGPGGRFCDLGGAICLVTDAVTGSQTYRLNLDTLSRLGFRVDSQLLRPRPRTGRVEKPEKME